MRFSRLSVYKYAFFISIIVFLYSIFGKVAFAEERPGAGDDIPITDNIIHDNDGVIAGSVKTRANNADRTSFNYYYNSFNLFWKVSGTSIRLYGKTSSVSIDWRSVNDDGSERSGTVTRNGTITNFGNESVYKYEDMSSYPAGYTIFDTNIPIFTDDSDIEVYIATGNFDNAVNKDDVQPKPEVPAPVDLDLAESSKGDFGSLFTSPIVVSWKAGSNDSFTYSNMRYNLSYEIVYGYTHVVAGLSTDGTEDTGKIQVATIVKYDNENANYTIGVKDLNDSVTRSILGLNIAVKTNWIESVTIWIQNADNSDFTNVSGEKYVQYNFKSKTESSDSPPASDGSTGGSPSEGGGTGTGSGSGQGSSNSSINNSPTFNNNPNITISNSNVTGGATDNYITNAVSGFLNASDTLGQNVHSGFGLLGDNGFLAAVGSMFTFVPTEIMTMIGMTVAACMLMFVVGAVVWFIRG